MTSLDNVAAMQKLDPGQVLESTAQYVDQCEEAWRESSQIDFPLEYKTCFNVVVVGMGGSQFPARTVKALFFDQIAVPYEIVSDYTLPSYVHSNSVVVLSSYSGTTEEPIYACGDALNRGAKITGVTRGGQVAEFLRSQRLPSYIFSDRYNPCGEPRVGGGYMLLGHMGLLKSLGLLAISDTQVEAALGFARNLVATMLPTVSEGQNPAKQLARILQDTQPFFIGAGFLQGFLNGFGNQVNETAKTISDFRVIPELNHHLLEGLQFPATLHETGLFVFIESDLYSDKIKKRFVVTKDVVKQQKVKTHVIKLTGSTQLAQVLEGFVLSSFTTFYMAMLRDLDPASVPWVDYFKKELAR